jgi:hypothetical protein
MNKRRDLARIMRQQAERARPKKENVPSFKHKNMPEIVETIPPQATVKWFMSVWSARGLANRKLQTFTLGECSILLTKEYGLLHMSISHPSRYPNWDEIAAARYRLIPTDRDAIMVLPPVNEYINHHEFCFQVHETVPGSLDAALNLPTQEGPDGSDPASHQ